jgi:hypothetical protein
LGLSILLWFGSFNHCIIVCFIWSKNCEHSSSNHDLYSFCSYRSRLSLAEILIVFYVFLRPIYVFAVT